MACGQLADSLSFTGQQLSDNVPLADSEADARDRPVESAAESGAALVRLGAERRDATGGADASADRRGAHSIAHGRLRHAPLCLVLRQQPVELPSALRIDAHLAATAIAQRRRAKGGACRGHLRVADLCSGNGRTVSGAQCCAIGGRALGNDGDEQHCHRQRNPC